MWLQAYEDDDFVSKVDNAWDEIVPLYNELHTYVRRKLKELYGDKMDDSDGLIPAHILGNMWYEIEIQLPVACHRKSFFQGTKLGEFVRTHQTIPTWQSN